MFNMTSAYNVVALLASGREKNFCIVFEAFLSNKNEVDERKNWMLDITLLRGKKERKMTIFRGIKKTKR